MKKKQQKKLTNSFTAQTHPNKIGDTMTGGTNKLAKDLITRMDNDIEGIKREQDANRKIEPLKSRMTREFYRFTNGPPNRLHVSTEIYKELLDCLRARGGIVTGNVFFLQCPVTEFPDLDGFRWVRERPKSWDCGPIHKGGERWT